MIEYGYMEDPSQGRPDNKSRRDFLRIAGAGIAGLAISAVTGARAERNVQGPTTVEQGDAFKGTRLDVIVPPTASDAEIQVAIMKRILAEPKSENVSSSPESTIVIKGEGKVAEHTSYKVSVSKTGVETQAVSAQESEPTAKDLSWSGAPTERFDSQTASISATMAYSVGDEPTDFSIFHFIQSIDPQIPVYDVEVDRGYLKGDGEIESSRAIKSTMRSVLYRGVLVNNESQVIESADKQFYRGKEYPSTNTIYIPKM
jgi:hypothetical protein